MRGHKVHEPCRETGGAPSCGRSDEASRNIVRRALMPIVPAVVCAEWWRGRNDVREDILAAGVARPAGIVRPCRSMNRHVLGRLAQVAVALAVLGLSLSLSPAPADAQSKPPPVARPDEAS